MSSSPVSAEFIALEAEIAELESRLIVLRRCRNAMMPIAKLSSDVISHILGHLIDLHIEKQEEASYHCSPSFRFYCWVSVTQFCAQWRSIALDESSLWTHIWTANLRWFKAFLERSKNRLLYIDTTPGYVNIDPRGELLLDMDLTCSNNHPDYHEMFHLLIANMHRVYHLILRPEDNGNKLSWLENVPAPQLGILQCVKNMESTFHRVFPIQFANSPKPVDADVMPKLRNLHIKQSETRELERLFPLDLPSVTDLTLDWNPPQDQLEFINRCKATRHLSIKGTERETSWVSLPKPLLVELPNLRHLRSQFTPWAILDCLVLPCLQQINLETRHVPGRDPAMFSIFTKLMRHSPVFQNIAFDIHFIRNSFKFTWGNDNDQAFLDVTIQLASMRPWDDYSGHITLLENFLRLVDAIGGSIQSVDFDSMSDVIQKLLPHLHDRLDISTIRVRELRDFLPLPSASQHVCTFNETADPETIHDCESCYAVRYLACPSLTTLIVDIWSSISVRDAELKSEELRLLMKWLQERRRRGIGLAKLRINIMGGIVSPEALNLVKTLGVVDEVIVISESW